MTFQVNLDFASGFFFSLQDRLSNAFFLYVSEEIPRH